MFNPAMFESMKHMINGSSMKQGAEMMSKMSDQEIKQYMNMTGLNVDPSILRSASANMAKMDESTLEHMKNTAGSRIPQAAPQAPPSPSELSLALSLKNQGNDLFKQGKTLEASGKYKEGIIEIEKKGLTAGASELEVTLRMNLAACLVKSEDYSEVIVQCKKTLVLGDNAKAFYRYGQALHHMGDSVKALEYLEKAKKISPEDANILKLLAEVNESTASKIKDQPKDRGVEIEVNTEEVKKPIKLSQEKPKIKEVPVVEKPRVPEPPSVIPREMPNLSEEQMAKGIADMKNMSPETISQMANSLKTMDPAIMQSLMKSQGIDMPPEQIAKMADMITPETIKMMQSSLGGGLPGMPKAGTPQSTPDVAAMLNNPQLSQMASQMLAQQLGKRPEDVQSILSCIGKCMAFFNKIISIYNFFTIGNRKYIIGAAIVLALSSYFQLV